jgi:hypothetical protein
MVIPCQFRGERSAQIGPIRFGTIRPVGRAVDRPAIQNQYLIGMLNRDAVLLTALEEIYLPLKLAVE